MTKNIRSAKNKRKKTSKLILLNFTWLFLILIEIFTKKRLPVEKEGLLNLVGLILLLMLMIAVTFKDIITLF